jgi:hypothetical protein
MILSTNEPDNALVVNDDCSVTDEAGNLWGHVTKHNGHWLWDNGNDTKWFDATEIRRIATLLDMLNAYLPNFSNVYPVGKKSNG